MNILYNQNVIPKIIHYCWFGKKPLPDSAIKCINSWKKFCKNFKIIEWNEKNFSIRKAPKYVKQAYKAKKYAFVTDYVRLYVLYNFGGVYMDTDVETVKPINRFLEDKAFLGFENGKNISTGIMASEPSIPIFKEFLSVYDKETFFYGTFNSEINYTTNVDLITNICLKYGLKQNNKYQIIKNLSIYPKEFFCPCDWKTKQVLITNNTCVIHWFNGSWKSKDTIFVRVKRKVVWTAKKVSKILMIKKFYNWMKRKI